METGGFWRDRLLPVLAFPGVLAALLLLEQGFLLPRAAERPPEATLALWQRHVEAHPDFAPSRTRLGHSLKRVGSASISSASPGMTENSHRPRTMRANRMTALAIRRV